MKELTLFIIPFFFLFYSCVEEPIIVPTESYISIIQPLNNTNVSDSISIIVDVMSLKEIIRVEVFIDHQLERVFTKPPYVFFWYVYYYSDGSQHIIEARAYDKDGGEMKTKPIIVNVYRFMPGNLQAFMNSDSAISLSWIDNSKIETGFELEHALNDSNFSKIAEVDSNVTSYVFIGNFNKSDKHFFRVRAKSQSEFSGYSNIAKAQIVLNKPTNVNVNFTSDTTATILWKDNSPFEIGYYLEIKRNNNWVFSMNYPPNTTRADIQCDFQSGYNYQCIVTARDTFQLVSSDPVYKQLSFYAPESLSVAQISESKIRLKWKNMNFFNTNYRIERKINDGNFFEIGITNPTQLYFENDNLDTANTYYYRVSAFTRVNVSLATNPIKVEFLPFIAFDRYVQTNVHLGVYSYSVNGEYIVGGGYTQKSLACFLFNAETGALLNTFIFPPGSGEQIVTTVGISYDNSVVAASSDYNTKYVNLWNTSNGMLRGRISIGKPCYGLTFHYSKPIIVMINDNTVHAFDYDRWQHVFSYVHAAGINTFCLANKSDLLALRGKDGIIKIFDLSTGAFVKEFISNGENGRMTFSINDDYLIEGLSNKIRRWDLRNGFSTDYLNVYNTLNLTIHPKKDYLFFGSVSILDIVNWRMVHTIPISNISLGLRFKPDGNRIISLNSYSSGKFALWNYFYKWQKSDY